MKWVVSVIVFVVVMYGVYLARKPSDDSARLARQKAFDASIGPPPTASKPYNIMDYAKPVPHP